MNSYQLTLVIKDNLKEADRKVLLDDVSKRFGKLIKEDLWGNRDLAYPINHATKGYYAHYEFESDPGEIASLDKMIKLNEDVIRYLLLRK